MHSHLEPHQANGPVGVFEQIFGRSSETPMPPGEVLADLRREIGAGLEDIAQRCAEFSEAPDVDGEAEVSTGLEQFGEALRQTALALPEPDDPLRVVLLGRTQAGKSTLFGYLTGSDASPVGDGAQRTTRSIVAMPMVGRSDIELVDTPGVGAKDGDEDREMALAEARRADLVVWVATNNSQPSDTAAALRQVARWGVPFLLVFNCRDDLADETATEQFLMYPETVFADLEGHSDRLASFLDPHGQRQLRTLPIHAGAARLSRRGGHRHADLARESRVDELVAAIEAEADWRRHQRRAAAMVDTARRRLVDTAEALATARDTLELVVRTRREAGADLERRAHRLVSDADLQVPGEIDAYFRRFDGWAERHYQEEDAEIHAAWVDDERSLREDASELLRTSDSRLRRRIRQLDDDVAAAWSKKLEAGLAEQNQIAAAGLAPRWLDAAGRTAAGAIGTLVGGAIGTAVGNAPGAALGSMIGGLVGERLGSLLRLRGRQLSRRRATLHDSVREVLETVKTDVHANWVLHVDAIRQELDQNASERDRATARIDALAHHAGSVAGQTSEAVAEADRCLLRALLRLAGRGRLGESFSTVHRVPGLASLVLLKGAAFDELALCPMDSMLEDIRPVPAADDSVYRRAAYALDSGRRHIVLVPGDGGIRASIPEQLSAQFLAAEADLVSTVIDVPLTLHSTADRPTEVSA